MPKENVPASGLYGRYSRIHSLEEYTRYLRSQVDAAEHSGQLVGGSSDTDQTLVSMHGDISLSEYLSKLTRVDKIKLIHALVINDMETFTDMLVPPLQEGIAAGNISIDAIKTINLQPSVQIGGIERNWLSPMTLRIIDNVLKNEVGDELEENEIGIILSEVMSQIPDTLLSVQAKMKICNGIYLFFFIPRVHYSEPVLPREVSKDSGEISVIEFKRIVGSKMIDKGEYVLLCLGLLKTNAQTDKYIGRIVEDIRRYYLYSNYNDAIKLVTELAKSKYLQKNQRARLILEGAAALMPTDKSKQYSRRFFETRLAAFAQAQSLDVEAIKRVSAHFLPTHLRAIENAGDVVRLISVLGDLDLIEISARSEKIKEKSLYWRERGRIKKEDTVGRNDELSGKIGHSIFTRNKGIMTSNQPNYRDELAVNVIRNSSSDTSTLNPRAFYIKDKPDTVFVTAFSGHAFFYLALLEKYMSEHEHSPTLENDVNEFIKAVAITNISYGFHSLMEILEVFDEPEAKKIFAKYNVEILLDWSDPLLDATFADAQSYAKTQLLHRATTREVERYHSLYDAIKKQDLNRVVAQLEKIKQRGKKVKLTKDEFGKSVRILAVAIDFRVSKEIFVEILKYHSNVDRFQLAKKCIDNNYLDGVKALADAGYQFGMSELKRAIKEDNLELVRYLVEELNIPVTYIDGRIRSELFKAQRSQEMYNYLMSNGEAHGSSNELHRIILSNWPRENKCHAIVRILDDSPEMLIEKNAEGATPLLLELAKTPPDSSIVLTMVNHDEFSTAVHKVVDHQGYTPLTRAVLSNSPVEIIHALIKSGADVTLEDKSGQTILDVLSKIYMTKAMLPSARLIIAEIARANPKLLEKYSDEKKSPLAKRMKLENKRFYQLVNEAIPREKTKLQKTKLHREEATSASVSDHPSVLFSGTQRTLTAREFADAMWKVKSSLVSMNKSENIGAVSFQNDVMSLFELVDSLGRGKTPGGWEERITHLLANIESYIKHHPAEPRPQLQKIIEQSRTNIDEFTRANNKRLGFK